MIRWKFIGATPNAVLHQLRPLTNWNERVAGFTVAKATLSIGK